MLGHVDMDKAQVHSAPSCAGNSQAEAKSSGKGSGLMGLVYLIY